ncbi:MAG: hypothetical protein K6G00_03055 [Treponema sp.]|nr:hypothetical protein [Treponema sp.]
MKQCFLLKKIMRLTCIFSFFIISGNGFSQEKNIKIPFVKNILALPINAQTIEISWTIPEQTEDKTFVSFSIYRSTSPIISSKSLSSLEPISKVDRTFISYRDIVQDDKDYYYAIIINASEKLEKNDTNTKKLFYDEEYDTIPDDNSTACIIVVPGENATVSSVHAQNLPVQAYANVKAYSQIKEDPTERKMPLPYTDPLNNDNNEFKDEEVNDRKITYQSEEYAKELINDRNQHYLNKKLEKYIFSEDFICPTGGDEYLLFEILKDSFVKENYEEATSLLTTFLKQNRSEIITQKATFYLGESLYFTGNYKKAIQNFLQVYEAYPNLARKWIDSSLNFIK